MSLFLVWYSECVVWLLFVLRFDCWFVFDIAGVSIYGCLCWLLWCWWHLFVCSVGWDVWLIVGGCYLLLCGLWVVGFVFRGAFDWLWFIVCVLASMICLVRVIVVLLVCVLVLLILGGLTCRLGLITIVFCAWGRCGVLVCVVF